MISQYLRSKGILFVQKKRPSGNQAICACPKCGDKDFAISLDTGAYQCFSANKCGVRGSWHDFQKLFNDVPKTLNRNYFSVQPKKEYKKPVVKPTPVKSKSLEFLRHRGISQESIKLFRIVTTGDNNIAIPVYVDGELVNVKYRQIDPKNFWMEAGCAPHLFNRDNCFGDTAIICEGFEDAIVLHQYGIDAMSVPNGVSDLQWIDLDWEHLEQFDKIYLMFDNDTAGQNAVAGIAERLGKDRCYNVLLPHKDPSDCLKAGLDRRSIDECILQAKPFGTRQIIQINDIFDDLMESVKNPDSNLGVSSGFRELDRIIGGFRGGETTVWTGTNGSGKTTMLLMIGQHMMSLGVNTCIASLEMKPKQYVRWAISQYAKTYPTEQHIVEFTAKYNDNLYIYNSTKTITPDAIFEAFEYAVRRYGVKQFFLDSLMKISFDNKQSDLKSQHQFSTRMKEFAEEHDCHFHLVAHPRKADTDAAEPGKVDVAGSGHITDLADNVIVMYREENESAGYNNSLFVKKNREYGRYGKVYFRFNEFSKSFTEMQDFKPEPRKLKKVY